MTTNKKVDPSSIDAAIKSAKSAFDIWEVTPPSKRAALLYDYADLLEKEADSILEPISSSEVKDRVGKSLSASIERIFWYAGWCDKIAQVYSSINPVLTEHVSVTSTEPMGVIGVLSPKNQKLLGVFTAALPLLAAGNSVVVVVQAESECEVLKGIIARMEKVALPKGLVEVFFGDQKELGALLGGHSGIVGIAIHSDEKGLIKTVRDEACKTIKYMEVYDDSSEKDLYGEEFQSPYRILPFVEFKTTWHPVTYLKG